MNTREAYHKWLGIRPTEPLTHYRLLGIPTHENNPDVITHAADRQMSYVKQFTTGPHYQLTQEILNQLSQARLTLLDPNKKAIYDQTIPPPQPTTTPTHTTPPPRKYRIHITRKPKNYTKNIIQYAIPLTLTLTLISTLALTIIFTQTNQKPTTQTAQTETAPQNTNKNNNKTQPNRWNWKPTPQQPTPPILGDLLPPQTEPQPPLTLDHNEPQPCDPLTLEPINPNNQPHTPILGDLLNNSPNTALNDSRLNNPSTEETNETETTEEDTPKTPLRTQRNNIVKQITTQELTKNGLSNLTVTINYQPNKPKDPNTTYVSFTGTLDIKTIALAQARQNNPNLLTTLQNLQKQNPDRTISWLGRINKKTGKLTLDSQKIFTATETNMQDIIEELLQTTGERLATQLAQAYKETPYPELPHTATVQPPTPPTN
jgi:hypothetical protein